MAFFSGGALLLISALMLIWRWLKREPRSSLTGHGTAAVARLGGANPHPPPPPTTPPAGLRAAPAFLLAAAESSRRRPESDFGKKDGGSGGCPVLIETNLPIFFD